jgi:hypothetical protein
MNFKLFKNIPGRSWGTDGAGCLCVERLSVCWRAQLDRHKRILGPRRKVGWKVHTSAGAIEELKLECLVTAVRVDLEVKAMAGRVWLARHTCELLCGCSGSSCLAPPVHSPAGLSRIVNVAEAVEEGSVKRL